MDQETIKKLISNLSKQDFDGIASLVLNRFFNLSAIDVDSKGDGGSDYRTFADTAGEKVLAIQKTVQDNNWKNKAFDDAKKAQETLGAKRYFFITSRAHEASSFYELQEKLLTELSLPSIFIGANEIAGLIVSNNLLHEFSRILDLKLNININNLPDTRERLLYTYFSISNDRASIKNEMYEGALLSVISQSDIAPTRAELLKSGMDFLSLEEARRTRLDSRIDALLSKNKIIKKNKKFYINKKTLSDLQLLNAIYTKEIGQLSGAQSDLISSYGGSWGQQQSNEAAIHLAKCFVDQQIESARHCSLSFRMTGFGQCTFDSQISLKEMIIKSGVNPSKVNIALQEMIDLAEGNPIIDKITDAIVYVALESSDTSKCAAILGANNWHEIKVILDASVAIPYLCSSLFSPSSGRFSVGSKETVKILKKEGSKLVIPYHYLNECASHLVTAHNYCKNLKEFENDFAYSRNGYVAHYYQLKLAGGKIPTSLKDYLSFFSRNSIVEFEEWEFKNQKSHG